MSLLPNIVSQVAIHENALFCTKDKQILFLLEFVSKYVSCVNKKKKTYVTQLVKKKRQLIGYRH